MYIHSVIQAYKSVHAQCAEGSSGLDTQVCLLVGGTRGGPEPCVRETQTHFALITNSHQS